MENNAYKIVEDNLIVRFDPQIYAFSTNTIPNYLKVGDTFRGVDQRISEWEAILNDRLAPQKVHITREFDHSAKIKEKDIYFRDYSVHEYLRSIGKKSLTVIDEQLLKLYSEEFFKDTTPDNVKAAINAIINDANSEDPEKKYKFYKVSDHSNLDFHYNNDKDWKLRPNQGAVVQNFIDKKDKNELLMFAVMRFGKSFTAMQCAMKTCCKKVLIVSAKADVKSEWKRTVEMPKCFKEYSFICDDDFKRGCNLSNIEAYIDNNKKTKIAVFLTLQNLSGKTDDGENIKNRLKSVFETEFDLVIVDETHFGAWSDKYGAPLKDEDKEFIESEKKTYINLITKVNKLRYKKKLHLSGTPYNLLYDKKFDSDNIVATCQFKDILSEKNAWEQEHFEDIEKGEINPETGEPYQEYDNPYFGFPQMLRFAFNLPKTARDLLANSKKTGGKWSLNDLFETKHNSDDTEISFIHESEVLRLLKVIDGSEECNEVLGFLNVPKIKNNQVCKHIVMVLPYKYCCDAMEQLIDKNKGQFINLKDYKVLNITGHTVKPENSDVERVKEKIDSLEKAGIKTITLTVQKMLTGVTVKEWDTMIMLKNTRSAQEYDQAVFRIQNQYVKEYDNGDHKTIKIDMKPQTILVDFDPVRMFEIQGLSARVVNEVQQGSISLEESVKDDLKYFPIITYNADKLVKVEPQNLVEIISKYNSEKSIMDETSKVTLDWDLLQDNEIRRFIESQSETNLSNALTTDAHVGENSDFNTNGLEKKNEIDNESKNNDDSGNKDNKNDKKVEKELEKKYRMAISNLSFYAFLSNSNIETLRDILSSISEESPEKERNNRIFKHLRLSKTFIEHHIQISSRITSLNINDVIHKANLLSRDENLPKENRVLNALSRFSRISNSEVITPLNICREMLDTIGDDKLIKVINSGGRILDIAGKTGEFAFTIYDKFKNKTNRDKLKNAIYTIPTSSVTYEFTRYIYETLGLNVENISEQFFAYDLLENRQTIVSGKRKGQKSKQIDYKYIKTRLTQNKPFYEITLNDDVAEGDDKVNFAVIVGNPPYQRSMVDTSDEQIYNEFMDLGYAVSPKCCFISPAKFLFNAGKTPKSWNNKMLNDEHIKVSYYEPDGEKVFSGTEIKGGVAITYRDEDSAFGAIGVFLKNPVLGNILRKVLVKDKIFIDSIVYSPESYKFSSEMHKENPEAKDSLSSGHKNDLTSNVFEKLYNVLFFETIPESSEEYISILGRKNNNRCVLRIKKKYIKPHPNLNCYKLAFPKVNGNGIFGEVLTAPEILGQKVGHTQTFLSMGAFESKLEAENLSKYLSSKFARAMLGILKATHDNKKSVWKYVPIQDFTDKSDIDWSKSIVKIDDEAKKKYGFDTNEIDAQLYTKYNLSSEEISFIEANVKPMDYKPEYICQN